MQNRSRYRYPLIGTRLGAFLLTASLAACGGGAGGGSAPVSLQAAENAYARFELDAAKRGFRLVYDEGSLPTEDRVEAALRLAGIERLINGDHEQAVKWLSRALEFEGWTFDIGVERSRILSASADWLAAQAEARRLVAATAGAKEESRAVSLLSSTAWRRVVQSANEGQPMPADVPELADLARRRVDSDWGRLELSVPALGLALAADDGGAALLAWGSYFHWAGRDDRHYLSAVGARLEPLLRGWRGPAAEASERRDLFHALVDSRLFDVAFFVALDPRVPQQFRIDDDPTVRALVAYRVFRGQIAEAAQAQYRRRALGDEWSGDIAAGFAAAGPVLWDELAKPGSYSQQALIEELKRRFGSEIHLRGPQGRNLHYGYLVDSREIQAEQYGRSATLRFVRLDLMVSNGFNSWFWDGDGATGGWADGDTIVQVRPPYAAGAVGAWTSVTDPVERQRRDTEIEQQRSIDSAEAERNRFAYFEGLRSRLRRQAHSRLLGGLRSQGLEGLSLRRKFIVELSQITFQSSIVAHEGRHAIDHRAEPLKWLLRSDTETEYRAKLSEVAFATDPRVALIGGILNPNIGADTAHGQANLRIMKRLVEWMEEHATEVDGLDAGAPLLLQLDLLSNDQLREAFRSMDPWQ